MCAVGVGVVWCGVVVQFDLHPFPGKGGCRPIPRGHRHWREDFARLGAAPALCPIPDAGAICCEEYGCRGAIACAEKRGWGMRSEELRPN